jgi:hypothetical protein
MSEIGMSRLTALGLMFGIAALGACADTIVSAPEASMTILAGDAQSATVGRPLPEPLTIAVTTSDGAGVPDLSVTWAVMTGGGSLSESSVRTNAEGQASVTWTLGAVAGTQSVAASVTGVAGSPTLFSASAAAAPPPPTPVPIVLHYDGTAWSTALEDINGARVSLSSIWGASSSAVFAVGGSCGNPLVLRYDGTGWGPAPPSCSGNFFSNFTSVWGNSASDVFAADRNGIPPKLGGSIDHYDGQSWTFMSFSFSPCPLGILCPAWLGVWSSTSADAFAVGGAGLIAHYDGTSWNQQTSGTTQTLNAVWGVGATGAVFAVGDGGTILYYDRSAWRAQTSGTTQPLYAVWGTSANDVFAVGAAGTVLHYDGTTWTAQNSGTTQSLYGIWGNSGSSVSVVGDASTIIHYNGTSWTAQSTAASMNLRGVWGSSGSNVFAVGAPR